jgi:hypothetical protein
MNTVSRTRILLSAFAVAAALPLAGSAAAQSEMQHKPPAQGTQGAMGQGMGDMGGMMGMMQGCPMMRMRGGGMGGGMGSGMAHGMPHLPPGNEKLEMQMHADMMRAIADVMTKYAARLPDRK